MNISATQYHLDDLVIKTNSEKAIISSFTGLTMFSSAEHAEKEDVISALATTLFSISKSIVSKSNDDNLNQICLQNENGAIFIKLLTEDSFITLFTSNETDLNFAKRVLDATVSIINTPTEVLELV